LGIRIRSCLWLFGWVVLGHLLFSLLGFGLLNLVFDPLGGGSNAAMLFLSMMLSWFLWGWLAPKKARTGKNLVLLTLSIWTILTGASHLLWGNSLIIHVIPQYLTAIGLLAWWPGSHHSRWYFDVLEPAMMAVSHFLLPAIFGLGMLLPPPQKNR